MTLPSQYSLLDSEFNGFLFATVGTEGNGMTLSVLSALTRLDIDPWAEAARLARLPKPAASRALAALIARVPTGLSAAFDADSIAARLVELLPRGAAPRGKKRGRLSGWRPPAWIYPALTAAALVAVWVAIRSV